MISPWLPSACRFHPTCSCYMREAIVAHGAAHGVWLGVRLTRRIRPEWFYRLAYAGMLLTGVKLLSDGLRG